MIFACNVYSNTGKWSRNLVYTYKLVICFYQGGEVPHIYIPIELAWGTHSADHTGQKTMQLLFPEQLVDPSLQSSTNTFMPRHFLWDNQECTIYYRKADLVSVIDSLLWHWNIVMVAQGIVWLPAPSEKAGYHNCPKWALFIWDSPRIKLKESAPIYVQI